ncbi:hypothetical protein E4U46_004735 [Claviceps purpurea]|nr:hypothetical protein E4U46_004735 [Claviceps purpurea]
MLPLRLTHVRFKRILLVGDNAVAVRPLGRGLPRDLDEEQRYAVVRGQARRPADRSVEQF